MRISIWPQWASNHGASFAVGGEFECAEMYGWNEYKH